MNQTIDAVASALMPGPVYLADQIEAVREADETAAAFALLLKAACKKGPAGFDGWLKNVREHGYLALVRGTRLKGVLREEAACRAEKMYNALLWQAYEQMARCYGSLMWWVLQDLHYHAGERHGSDVALVSEELFLFSQMHLPQLHLACLPMDFLEGAQWRWALAALKGLWWNGHTDPEAYDSVTTLLGLSGQIVRRRREIDRERKRLGKKDRGHIHVVDPKAISDRCSVPDSCSEEALHSAESWSDEILEKVRAVQSCPVCRAVMKLCRVISWEDLVIEVECLPCRKTRRAKIDLKAQSFRFI